tara:strand:- start:52382 stop:53089 length:708 start_codon:yes stop_codon:yes gene_type:complete
MEVSEANMSDDTTQVRLFPAMNREMLHVQIYNILCDNMMMGRFAPGQKLVLRSLAKDLGTSLMPVRDALQRLESQGCVISTPQRTMMVPILTPEANEGICHLRRLLEGDSARRAALNCSADQLLRLGIYCDDIREADEKNDLDQFLTANFRFHMLIAEASGTPFIVDMLQPLWMRIGPMVRAAKPERDHLRKAVVKHEAIFAALKARDPDAAEATMRADITECQMDLTIPQNLPI